MKSQLRDFMKKRPILAVVLSIFILFVLLIVWSKINYHYIMTPQEQASFNAENQQAKQKREAVEKEAHKEESTKSTHIESRSIKSDWEKEGRIFEEMDRINEARRLDRIERERREIDKYREYK